MGVLFLWLFLLFLSLLNRGCCCLVCMNLLKFVDTTNETFKGAVTVRKQVDIEQTMAIIDKIKKDLYHREDLVIRPITVNDQTVYFIYLTNTVELKSEDLQVFFSRLLVEKKRAKETGLLQACLQLGPSEKQQTPHDYLNTILNHQLLVVYDEAVRVNIGKNFHRAIGEVKTQEVVRGPREAFTESVVVNQAMLRERLKNKQLMFQSLTLGTETGTDVKVVYLAGVCKKEHLDDVLKRLKEAQIAAVLESHYLETLLETKVKTVFPTVYNTERPDVIAAGLLEGRIAVIVDGTPFVLLVPCLLFDFIQSSEDYYQRSDIASAIRMLRVLSLFIALLTPAVFIALTLFHQEVIPTALLVSLAAQREGIPFPALLEVLLMEITFELLREAGVRLPSAVGSAVSIVGALVLGQAAVEAGIVSNAMVIIVSITAISNFVFPSYDLAISIRLLRFVFILLASLFGLVGITLGLVLLVHHLTTLDSIGVSYLTGIAPYDEMAHADLWVRKRLDKRQHLFTIRHVFKRDKVRKGV